MHGHQVPLPVLQKSIEEVNSIELPQLDEATEDISLTVVAHAGWDNEPFRRHQHVPVVASSNRAAKQLILHLLVGLADLGLLVSSLSLVCLLLEVVVDFFFQTDEVSLLNNRVTSLLVLVQVGLLSQVEHVKVRLGFFLRVALLNLVSVEVL